jgi:lysophospholipase L1-like esterase
VKRALESLVIALVVTYAVLLRAMRRPIRALMLEVGGLLALWAVYAGRFGFDHPAMLLPEVLLFRLNDHVRPPPPGRIIFTGSSTIAHWASLAQDMAPLPVLKRGIDGARLQQLAAYADQIITPYSPRGVVVYAGENDIAGFLWSGTSTPEDVLVAWRNLCTTIHQRLPEVPIYFISIKPAARGAGAAARFAEANRLIRASCEDDDRLHYIDVVSAMLSEDGEPRRDIFQWDGFHLNATGYRILSARVKSAFVEAEGNASVSG